MQAFVVFTTAPDLKTARKLAQLLIKGKAAACVSLVPGIKSFFSWKNKISVSSEILLMIKTTKSKLVPLEKAVSAAHPYDVPEFLSLKVASGSRGYMAWIEHSLK